MPRRHARQPDGPQPGWLPQQPRAVHRVPGGHQLLGRLGGAQAVPAGLVCRERRDRVVRSLPGGNLARGRGPDRVQRVHRRLLPHWLSEPDQLRDWCRLGPHSSRPAGGNRPQELRVQAGLLCACSVHDGEQRGRHLQGLPVWNRLHRGGHHPPDATHRARLLSHLGRLGRPPALPRCTLSAQCRDAVHH